MSRHVHVFSSSAPGVDVCTECPTEVQNPHTAEQAALSECPCGRGLARFLDGDRTPEPVCAACLAELDRAQEVA